MLSEEALVLYATAAACVLLVLGVLELLVPTRPRHSQRPGAARDPWRRARTTAAPAAARPRESAFASGPTPPVRPPMPQPVMAPPSPPPRAESPIERLLRSQVEATASEAMGRPEMPRSVMGGPDIARSGAGGPDTTRSVIGGPDTTSSVVGGPDVARSGMGGPDMAPQVAEAKGATPPSDSPGQRSEHPSEAGALRGDPSVVPVTPMASVAPVVPPVAEPVERPAEAVGEPGAARPGEQEPAALPEPQSLVDRCFALYHAGRLQAVISEAMDALETVRAGALSMEPLETARLWGLVALARQAQGERDGARAALEEALAVAPSDDRATWQRHLATLALEVGQDLVAQAQSGTADAEERVTTLHAALGWLESGLAVAPDDGTLREAATAARAALWPTYEQAVNELLQRQDYQVARRVLRQAQAEENCPAELQTSFREMLASTYGGEVGQLTAEAIKRMQEGKEGDALVTLDRAEEMLGIVPEGGLPSKRRHELERRLWWSYTKVGLRRVDGGLYEEALPPLLHALSFHGVGPERREETKAPLIRALEAIVAARSPLIQRMTAEGDRDGALVLCEKLWSFLQEALERGLTKEELAGGLARTQGLFEKLGKPQP